MQKKAKTLIYSLFFFLSLFCVELFFINSSKSVDQEQLELKRDFVALTSLPDLSISTEATFIRHRSLSSTFDIYKDDGLLREYFPSSFVIMESKVVYE